MTYVAPVLIFLMVLSPLYIPVGATLVDVVMTWRDRRLDTRRRMVDGRDRSAPSRARG